MDIFAALLRDDELPVDVKQEEYTKDSIVTYLLLESDNEDTSLDSPDSPGYQGSPKHATHSTDGETEVQKQGGFLESERIHFRDQDKDIRSIPDVVDSSRQKPPIIKHTEKYIYLK